MFCRKEWLVLIGFSCLAGSVAAKPPGLPINPQPAGEEPTPMAREFYTPTEIVTGMMGGYVTGYRPDPDRTSKPVPLGEMLNSLQGWLTFDRFTIPLGVAEVQE